jgi:hypothetical protein
MKSIWKKIGLAIIALTMSSQAFALILIEPFVGYDFSLKGEDKVSGQEFDFTGPGGGIRLGLQLTTLMVGITYDLMKLDFEPDGGGEKLSVDQTNFGVFVGWNPLISGIRFWGEYFFQVKNEFDNFTEKGDGWGLGIGYKLAIPLAFNAEYRSWAMDDPAGTDTTGDSIFVSVSAPFNIL